MGRQAGMVQRAGGLGGEGGQNQHLDPAVPGFPTVAVQARPDHRQQAAAHHPVAPHQDGLGVMPPHQGQEIPHPLLHPGGVLRIKGAVGQAVQLAGLAGDRVHPGRVGKGVVVVGAQMDHHRVGLPGGEVIGLLSAPLPVLVPPGHPAHPGIIGGQGVAGVVVKTGHNPPAALGHHPVFRPQGVGGEAGVVVPGRKQHPGPVLFPLGADGPLPAGDAVPHEFNAVPGRVQGEEFPLCKGQPLDLEEVGGVVVHGLGVLEDADVLGPAGGHPPEDTAAAAAGVHRKAGHPRPVQLHADPGLHDVIAGVPFHPQLAAGELQLDAAAGPEQGLGLPVRMPAQHPHLGQGGQRQGCQMFHDDWFLSAPGPGGGPAVFCFEYTPDGAGPQGAGGVFCGSKNGFFFH